MKEVLSVPEVVGLACLAFAVSAGSVLDWYHDWAQGFAKPSNVFRILSDGLGCPMCFGFWVGFIWAVGRLPWGDVVLAGGFVSGAAMILSELVTFQREVRERISLPVKTAKAASARAAMEIKARAAAEAKAQRGRVVVDRENQLMGVDAAFNAVREQIRQNEGDDDGDEV